VSSPVLDASALLALLYEESGAERVEAAIVAGGVGMSLVNYAEVLARLVQDGQPLPAARETVGLFEMDLLAFDEAIAARTADLRQRTRHLGLSLGDRACLATGAQLNRPVLTADRAWLGLDLGAEVICVR
jgi:ribonuclease VapC